MRKVESTTLQVIDRDLPTIGVTTEPRPAPPEWAVDVPAYRSGYLQTIHPEALVAAATATGVTASITRMVGEHVIAGSALDAGVAGPDPARRRHWSGSRRPLGTPSGSASSGPLSRTSRSVSGGSRTSRSRRCRPPSTIPTPRSRRSSTCRSSSPRWPGVSSAASSCATRPAWCGSSYPAGISSTTSIWHVVRYGGMAKPNRESSARSSAPCTAPGSSAATTTASVRHRPAEAADGRRRTRHRPARRLRRRPRTRRPGPARARRSGSFGVNRKLGDRALSREAVG